MARERGGEQFRESDYPEFATEVNKVASGDTVPDDFIVLRSGLATATIRRFGAVLTSARLVDTMRGRIVEAVYADQAKLTTAKLAASHTMMPVGPYEGAGGQHGFPRRVNYSGDAATNGRFAFLEAELGPNAQIGLDESFSLQHRKLSRKTIAVNRLGEDMATSIGQHLYVAMSGVNSLWDMRFAGLDGNPRRLDEMLGEGVTERVMAGEAQFWPGYRGNLTVHRPDGVVLGIEADCEVPYGLKQPKMGMLIWQRQDEHRYVCLEPTVGLYEKDGERFNDGLILPSEQSEFAGYVALQTTVALY